CVDRHGGWTERIVLQTIGKTAARPEVQERIHVDLIVEDPESATYHQIAPGKRLIGEPNPRCEVIFVWRENGTNLTALNLQAIGRSIDREILAVAVERPKIFVANSVCEGEPLVELPAVLHKQVEGVDLHV